MRSGMFACRHSIGIVALALLGGLGCAEGSKISVDGGIGGIGDDGPSGSGGSGSSAMGSGGACPSQTESCDGLDNDCDGTVDEGCSCESGSTQACYSGPANTKDVGMCRGGVQACSNGAWGTCNGEVAPVTEICDGLDNDCSGGVDDTFGMLTCGMGQCAATVAECANGQLGTCVPGQPSAEICDGLDNDCNGTNDDNNPGGNAACSTGLMGVCGAGTSACTSGAIVCNQNVQPSAESCDGLDNDCNGVADPGCCNNIAPQATASVSAGGGSVAPWNAAAMNNGQGTCASGWAWVTNSSSANSSFFMYEWPAAVVVGSFTVDAEAASGGLCDTAGGRDVKQATVQYWDLATSTWVTVGTIANRADYNFVFPAPVTTTRIRLANVTCSAGSSNSKILEWLVYPSTVCVTPP